MTPKDGADFGDSHAVSGTLTGPYNAPLVGRQVELAGAPVSVQGRQFKAVATATTGADGRFAFEHAFDRNQQVRVVAPGDRRPQRGRDAYVFPRTDARPSSWCAAT